MRGFRRRVRLWVTAWLLCQFAAVSAFAPRECCAAHQPAPRNSGGAHAEHGASAPAGAHAGHESHAGHHGATPHAAAAGRHADHATASQPAADRADATPTRRASRAAMCPMRGPNGEPCPMHADQDAEPPSREDASTTPTSGTAPAQRDCVMRGACKGPITAVVTLFLTPADPLGSYTLAPDDRHAALARPATEPTLDFDPSVFTPPPRA